MPLDSSPKVGSDEDTLQSWQREAAFAVLKGREPQAAFSVLQRTIEMAASDFRLKVLNLEEIEYPPELLAQRILAEAQGDAIPAEASFIRMDADTRTTEVCMPSRGVSVSEATALSMNIDRLALLGDLDAPIPDFILDRLGEVMDFDGIVSSLAKILYEQFGDEVIDLALALHLYGLSQERGQEQDWEAVRGMVDEILSRDFAQKKAFFDHLNSRLQGGLTKKGFANLTRWALGDVFYESLAEDDDSPETVWLKFKELLLEKPHLRRKCLRALRDLAATQDRLIASAFVRQGWRTLIQLEDVSDWEWWSDMKDSWEAVNAMSDEKKKALFGVRSDQDEEEAMERIRTRSAIQKQSIDRFFAKNSDPPEQIKHLAETIDIDRCRKELSALKVQHNPIACAAKQVEIINRVFAAVTRFRMSAGSDEKFPTYEEASPAHVAQHKSANCFSGPWLISTMLFACGFDYSDIAYCHVNKAYNGILGGHGSIMVRTKMRDIILIDHGFNIPIQHVNTALMSSLLVLQADDESKSESYRVAQSMDDIQALFSGKRNQGVHMKIPLSVAYAARLHPDMHVLPLLEGFESGHLLHVGISFFDEGRYDEAQYSLEMALHFHSHDPDILYYLGMVHVQKGNVSEAKLYFEESIGVFDEHLKSHHALAQLLYSEGDEAAAIRHWKLVADSKMTIYRDDVTQKEAKDRLSV